MSGKSRAFWRKQKDFYPFKESVPHMSRKDIDPRTFQAMSEGHFIRVPFDGLAHWGFKLEKDYNLFMSEGGKYERS